MSHNLEIASDGSASLMLANNPAWHSLGTILPYCPNSHEAITVARADYHVCMEPLQTTDGLEVPGHFVTRRQGVRGPSGILGVVSDRYRVVQNTQAFTFLDSLVDEGEMRYESCGVMNGGRNVWILARLPSVDEIAEGDDVLRYLLMGNSHDGKSAIDIMATSVRVVCANTYAEAKAKDGSRGLSIRHKGDMRAKLDDARKLLSQFDAKFTLFRDSARLLVDRKVSPDQAKEYMLKLFPEPQEKDGRAATVRANKVEECRRAFRFSRNQIASIRGTWWQLLNSITDVIDHPQRKDIDGTRKAEEKHFASTMNGSGAEFKDAAFKLAVEMSA